MSATEYKYNLESQAGRVQDYCAAKGYQVAPVVKEIGSGVNHTASQVVQIVDQPRVTVIVVEHKGRLARFGFNYLEQLLAMQGRRIEVIN